MANRGAEFSETTRRIERRRWRLKNPDKLNQPLQIHHIVNVWAGEKYGVPRQAMKSQMNAVAVTPEFHQQIHRDQDEETQFELAQYLISVYRTLL